MYSPKLSQVIPDTCTIAFAGIDMHFPYPILVIVSRPLFLTMANCAMQQAKTAYLPIGSPFVGIEMQVWSLWVDVAK